MHAATYTTLPGLRVTRSGGGEMELFADHSPQRHLPSFSRIFHQERYGEMDFQYFIGRGFQIWRSHYLMREQMKVRSQGDVSTLELHIPIAGEAISWWDGQKENRLRKHQFELEYIPFIDHQTLFAAHCASDTLDIHYDPNFLKSFAERFSVLHPFLLQVDNHKHAQLLSNAVRFISPQMMRIAHHMLQYAGSGETAEYYYEQQASLLLETVLERTMQINPDYSRKKYLDAAMSVRDVIERHPATTYTGKMLSAYTGINVSLLHKIFRDYNGTTLFEFGQGIRLEHAKVLLRDTSLYIFEIALECGYPEHANFTAAFRKRFGLTPQQYRNTLAGRSRSAE